jgi:membrane protease YdiL (CAAX protease family)
MTARVRAGLRLGAWFLATFLVLAVTGAVVGPGVGNLTGYAIFDALLLLVSLACWRILERRTPGATPLAVNRGTIGRALRGARTGALLVAALVAALALAGVYDLAPRACRPEPLLRFVAATTAFVALAALFEEALFRGYALFALRDVVGSAGAVILTALLFAAAHLSNPGFGGWAAANLALVGAVLAAWILAERDVWVAVGAHAGWNAAIVLGAAIPVSGLAIPSPCHVGVLRGPDWLTGGSFGLEAALPTAVVWVGLGAWLAWTRSRRARLPVSDRARPEERS